MNARPDHTAIVQAGNKELLLASMRVASLNLRTWVAEVDACGIALRGGAINLDEAVAWMDDCGLLAYLPENKAAA